MRDRERERERESAHGLGRVERVTRRYAIVWIPRAGASKVVERLLVSVRDLIRVRHRRDACERN